MKTLFIALIFCCQSAAQTGSLTITVQGATPTQALLSYTAPDSNACSVQVSESASLSPLVADLDPALYAGAGTDSAYNLLPAGTVRLLRVGRRTSTLALDGHWHSRALAAETTHYVQVICGASSGTTTFVTGVPQGFAPEPLPTDLTGWGNLAYPEFDFTDVSKPVIDPQTGMRIYTEDPNAYSSTQVLPLTPGWYQGGNGWVGPANSASYGTSVATTNGTSPLVLLVDTTNYTDSVRVSGGKWPFDNFLDLGVDLYGDGTDNAISANRTVQLALSLDSGQTAFTPWVNAVLPVTTGAAGTFPTNYPSAYFAGWGKVLPRDAWPKRGFVTVSASVVTLTKNDAGLVIGGSNWDVNSYFVHEWTAGTKIQIANSAPTCVNNLCTIASVQSATQLTIAENLTLAENTYKSAALAVIVQKSTGSGSIDMSARLRLAKGYPHDLWSGGCSPVSVTSGDGIVGYPCIFPRVRQDSGGLYFIGSSKPVIRLVSLFINPRTVPGIAGGDLPNGNIDFLGPSVGSFDPVDPTLVYLALPTNSGTVGLFKVKYTGNWSTLNIAYQSSSVIPPLTSELTWSNMTPSATGRDMRSQILSNTTYDESVFGSLTSLAAVGTTGAYALFQHTIGGQESVCWIFAFNSGTGNFYRGWRTDNGTSLPGLKYAGCHAVIPIDNNDVMLATNGLRWSTTNWPYGGPFTAPITAVMRNGAFDTTNTALPWPPAAPPATNGYDTTCPSNLAPQWQANGATGNQCVTVQTKEPCSSFYTAGELADSPCPWDGTKSMVAPLAEGDFLKWSSDYDGEGFMVVRKTSLGGGLIQLILQRNANISYCAYGKDGVDGLGQFVHANGWTYDAVPPFACNGAGIVIDMVNNASYVVNQNLLRGHFDVSGSSPGAHTWIGAGALDSQGNLLYLIDYNRQLTQIAQPADDSLPFGPGFAGYNSVHDVQSYIDSQQRAASPNLRRYAFDFRHYNGYTGSEIEFPSQTIGSPTNATLQSGTNSVYQVSLTGTPDVKRGILNLWAADKVLIEQSSPAQGNTLTDANAWRFCYAYNAGECRTGSIAGALYAVIPEADVKGQCWASQINLRVPCAMIGPVQAMRSLQIRIDSPDPDGHGQRSLGPLLMGPGHQYVYSKILPTPDASYLLFGGFLVDGYHTALMAAKLPSVNESSTVGSAYVPVVIKGRSSSAVYIEFGYEEYGPPSSMYCTPRQEACRAGSPTISNSSPFFFAEELFAPATGSYSIAIPALPGRILYYHVVENGQAGALHAIAVSSAFNSTAASH